MLSRSFSRPLEQITRAAGEVARGDYSVKVPVEGPAETRRLAASFNQMTDAVRRSQQTLRDFLANASHELKTPLTAVSGFAQAMSDGTISDREGLVRSARVIEIEARRVLHLVQEILDLSRLEAGQTKLSFGLVDLGELFGHVSEVFGLRSEETGVRLESDAGGSPPVVGDFDRLEQVLGNLIDNAFGHTPRGGRIHLGARPLPSGKVEIIVSDTGEGMPPDALDHIFERFFQVDGSTRRGTGLGLAITKEIVRAHGGDIQAESAVGAGTRFIITLPQGSVPAQRPAATIPPAR
jgi:signal transduction histidine kinase